MLNISQEPMCWRFGSQPVVLLRKQGPFGRCGLMKGSLGMCYWRRVGLLTLSVSLFVSWMPQAIQDSATMHSCHDKLCHERTKATGQMTMAWTFQNYEIEHTHSHIHTNPPFLLCMYNKNLTKPFFCLSCCSQLFCHSYKKLTTSVMETVGVTDSNDTQMSNNVYCISINSDYSGCQPCE